MTDDFTNEIAPPSKSNWLLTITLVAAAGLAFGWFIRELANPQMPHPEEKPHPAVGSRAPDLVVEGWFDGRQVTAEDLAGKVYVVDAWEFWCLPCLEAAPHSVEIYEKYKDQGVVFFGLTSAAGDDLEQSKKFLEQAKFPWPNAFGAAETLLKLYQSEQTMVPQLWVVDQQGVIAWAGHPLALKSEVLDRLLQAEAPATPETAAKAEAAAARTPSPGG